MTSIAVIGLYLAFAIPIWLRWRHGDNFEPGSWNNGAKYKWMNPIAVAEIVIVSVYLMLPFVPGANPFSDDFEWKYVNYAPVVTLGALLILSIWWEVSAKKWFTGPKHNIDPDVVEAARPDRATAVPTTVRAVSRGGGPRRAGGRSPGRRTPRRRGSYFSMPQDQKSKSIGLTSAWIEAHSVQPYLAISPSSRARATLWRRCRP